VIVSNENDDIEIDLEYEKGSTLPAPWKIVNAARPNYIVLSLFTARGSKNI